MHSGVLDWSKPLRQRQWRRAIGLALIYLLLSRFGHQMRALQGGDAVFWGLSGLSAAMIAFVSPRVRMPLASALLAAATLDNLINGIPFLTSVGYGVANTVEGLVAGLILARRLPRGRRVVRTQDIGWLALAAVAGSMAGTAGLAIITSALGFDLVSWGQSGYWLLSNTVAIFIGAPAVLAVFSLRREPPEEPILGRIMLLSAVTVGFLVVATWASIHADRNLSYLVIVPLVASAVWVGHRGTAPIVGGVAVIMGTMTVGGFGPFATADSGFDPLVATQLFMSVVQATVLTVGIESSRRQDLIAELDGILGATVEAVLVVDETGVIRKGNAGAGVVLGLSPEELFGTPLTDFVPDKGYTADEKLVLVEARRSGGEEFWAEISRGDIHEKNGRRRIAVVVRDVSERIETEARVRRMQDQFVSNMTHELKTPLTAIIGFSDWLLADPQAPTLVEDLETIKASAESMRALIDEILTFKRVMETSRSCEPVDMGAIVGEVLERARPEATRRQIVLDVELGDIPRVTGDPTQLDQVVGNLVSNAIKYSRPGGRVTVNLGPSADGVRLAVADDGIGIPVADQERLFERFFRARNVGDTPGTGLGLAMVRQIVETHAGTLNLTSAEGQGTKVEVCLPLPGSPSGATEVPERDGALTI